MNNLLETVWYENPVIVGAIAGIPEVKILANGKEYFIHGIYKHVGEDKTEDKMRIFAMACDYSSKTFLDVDECVLLTRSIDSLTDSEIDKTPSMKDLLDTELRPISISKKREWLKEAIETNELTALDFFYLCSIEVWTGSTKNTEVIK